MTIIDSHCHLDFPDFAEDLDGVVERARAAGVEQMITIGTRVDKAPGVVAIAERYDDVFFTVGTHPHEAAGEGAEDFPAMRAFAKHPKCVGIGEAGLDAAFVQQVADAAGSVTPSALRWIAASLSARHMARELSDSTDQMSQLVKAVKQYAYMDRGDVVQVELQAGEPLTLSLASPSASTSPTAITSTVTTGADQ